MRSTFSKFFALLIITLFVSKNAFAQPREGKFINAAIGLGISAAYDETDLMGSGFYAQGEYVIGLEKWFGLRPYAGFILTSADKNSNPQLQEYKVTSKAFFLGTKARFCAPIPWVAPYFEIGLGASIGSFVTYTPIVNIEKNGLLLHYPVTIGLALGRNNDVDIAFTYYYHPSAEQFSGAAAIGLSFPINK